MSAGIAASLALAEHYEQAFDEDGNLIVRVEDAHALTSGHISRIWPDWPSLPYREMRLIGRATNRRARSSADASVLGQTIYKIFKDGQSDPVTELYDPGPAVRGRITYLYPKHGQVPLDLADGALAPFPSEEEVVCTASGGGWVATTSRGRVQVAFPHTAPTEYEPEAIKTTGYTGAVPVKPGVLGFLARRADHALPPPAFRRTQVDLLLRGTLGRGAAIPARVDLDPGEIIHLSAPTGYGKNVTSRAQCWQSVREGRTILLVLPGNDDVFGEAATVRKELTALGIAAKVTPFVAAGSRHKVAAHAVGKATAGTALSKLPAELFAQFAEAGYSCALNAQLDVGERFEAGKEPCTYLKSSDLDEEGHRAACPFIGNCGKFSLLKAALTAQVVVTNHACLQKGMVKLPLIVDGELRRQMSTRELLLRLCDLVVIDEVDAYQSRGFDDCGSLELAVARRKKATPLRRIHDELYLADPGLRLEVRGPLALAVFLSEQLLDLVASGEVCTETIQARMLAAKEDPKRVRELLLERRRWYLIHRWDREIMENLLGVDAKRSASETQFEQLRALMPRLARPKEERTPLKPLPPALSKIPELLDRLLTVDESSNWPLEETKEALRDVVARVVKVLCLRRATTSAPPAPKTAIKTSGRKPKTPKPPTPAQLTAGVLHALMMKAFLSALNRAIFEVADHTDALAACGISAASELADAVGHLDTGSVVPFGPLGRQIGGFRFDGLDDPAARPRLALEVLRGDPHIETSMLGDIVSLALAGHRRTVLGMSATGFMPGAARTHLLTWPTYAMPDAQRSGLRIFRSTPRDADGNPLAVGGTDYAHRDFNVMALARGFAPDLLAALTRLGNDPATAHRARALIAVNSYRQARLFAQALHEACLAAGRTLRIFVATPDTPDPNLPPLPDGIVLVTRDQFAHLTDLGGEVLISPLMRTERGLNILATAPNGRRESAITLIALAIRPVMPLDDAAAMAASIAAYAWRNLKTAARPALTLAALNELAEERLRTILRAPQRFTALPEEIKLELIASLIVQVLQLAGRGRRGQTHVELHFLDHAFHDAQWGSDLPTLARKLLTSYSRPELQMIGTTYGYSGEELLDYANATRLRTGLRAGYPANFRTTP